MSARSPSIRSGREALRSLARGHRYGLTVVHPSWWSASRVDVVTGAARTLADDVVRAPAVVAADPGQRRTRRSWWRSPTGWWWLLATRSSLYRAGRNRTPVAEEVAGVIAGMTRGSGAVVVIDVPSAVAGAPALATLIAGAVRGGGSGQTVVQVDDARLMRLAREQPGEPFASRSAGGVSIPRPRSGGACRIGCRPDGARCGA